MKWRLHKKTSLLISRLIFIFALGANFGNIGAQVTDQDTAVKVIDIYNAERLSGYTQNGKSYQKLIGKVVLHHDGAMMFCDSAFISDDDNIARAFGHIHIQQGDSLDLYGDELEYDGNKRIAVIKKRVRLIDSQVTLNSDMLTYDRNAGMAYYSDSSITNTTNDNLTSKKGYYYIGRKEFAFKGDVVLVNPQYTLYSDTMIYNTVTDVTYFKGPSTIVSQDSYIYCENGYYDKTNDICQFNKNAYVIAENNILKGDSLYYERQRGYGNAIGNVSIEDTVESVIVTGQYAETFRNIEKYLVTDSAQMMQIFEDGDTLFMHADTLLAIQDSSNQRILNCFHHVKFFKSNMQGACDSLTYNQADSLLNMFYNPVIWNEQNQVTADKINLCIGESKIYWIDMLENALIISQEDSILFNQIGGNNMHGVFTDNELSKVDVFGNGKAIYYPKEDGGDVIGMNKVDCIDITLFIEDREISRIVFRQEPIGVLEPLEKINPLDYRLEGFKWWIDKRPKNRWEIFIHS